PGMNRAQASVSPRYPASDQPPHGSGVYSSIFDAQLGVYFVCHGQVPCEATHFGKEKVCCSTVSSTHRELSSYCHNDNPMGKHILITGGAGFIGSHVCTQLLLRAYKVRVLDSLIPQVHGPARRRPEYLHPEVELLVGDIRDPKAISQALEGIDAVI